MRKLILLSVLTLTGCSSANLIENWKNPDIVLFHADNVLIVGMARDQDVRESFESRLKKEFDKRNVDSMRSLDVFDVEFTASGKTEEDLDNVEQSLLDKDFDAILFTKVTGSEDRQSFLKTISKWDNYQGRFKDDYLRNQKIYYDPSYYDTFKVYHVQTTLYCICEGKERAMIWRGSIDITDPRDIEKSIKDYIRLVVLAMEEQDLIFKKDRKGKVTDL